MRPLSPSHLRRPVLLLGAVVLAAIAVRPGSSAPVRAGEPRAVVGFRSWAALGEALDRFPARIVRRVPHLRAVEVRPAGDPAEFTAGIARLPGIVYANRPERRRSSVEPALAAPFRPGLPYEWE